MTRKMSAQIEVEEMVGEEPNDQMKELEEAHADIHAAKK